MRFAGTRRKADFALANKEIDGFIIGEESTVTQIIPQLLIVLPGPERTFSS